MTALAPASSYTLLTAGVALLALAVFAAWAGPAAGSLLYAGALLGAYWLVALALARRRVSLRL